MHWASLRETTSLIGTRILLALYRFGGLPLFRICAWPVLAWHVWRQPLARKSSQEYLQRLYTVSGGTTPKPSLWQVIRHFSAFAETILEKLVITRPEALENIRHTLTGDEHIQSLLARKQGAVLVTAHMGNFELCRLLARARGDIRINVLVHTAHARNFNAMLHKANPDTALNLIQVTEINTATAVMLAERIDRGEFVVITGDRIPLDNEDEIVGCDFLGAAARFPLGPWLLASIFRCPLLSLLGSRRDDNTYHLTVTPLDSEIRLPRRNRIEAAKPLVAHFARLLEAECRAAPLQWFNFFPFWAHPNP